MCYIVTKGFDMTLESDVLTEIKPSPEECSEILAKAETEVYEGKK